MNVLKDLEKDAAEVTGKVKKEASSGGRRRNDKDKNGRKKKPEKDTIRHTLRQSFKASLGATQELREAVKCPPDQDRNEWIAMQVMELYNTLNLVCNFSHDYCTDEKCPKMVAAKGVQYLWADERTNKPVQVTAPQYTTLLLDWVERKFDDESVFPVDGSFSKAFMPEIQTICKRLFRIYAHIYHAHIMQIKQGGSEAHVNTSFKHFYYFVSEFALVDSKELMPMQSYIDKMCLDSK